MDESSSDREPRAARPDASDLIFAASKPGRQLCHAVAPVCLPVSASPRKPGVLGSISWREVFGCCNKTLVQWNAVELWSSAILNATNHLE